MLSSLDALANKISSGSGQNTASQQQQQTTHSSVCLDSNYHQLQHLKNSLTAYNTTSLYQQQQQSSQLRRLNDTLYNGLDSNESKLCHITHNSMHPYQKQQTNSPPVNRQHQRQKLSNFSSHTSITSASSSEESLRKQHELYQKQLQRQSHEFFLQQQHHQKQLQSSSQSTSCPPLVFGENDSQQDFANCLKKNTFGMSDKSSTTNSLPNSPIHTNNNNSILLKSNTNDISNNNNINNNNAYTVNDDGCVRMDADVTYSDKEPDPDNIKMFVGQVPKSMDEAQLREMFEEYGPVHSINVLRDKTTGISKGCCFVTFYTRRAALKAQDALHNIKTLKGMYHPIQMKPADSENRNDEVSGNSTFNSKSKSHKNNVSYTAINTNRQLTSVIDNITLDNGASVVDKTLNSLATSISINQKFITSVPSSLALVPTLTTFRSKPYASINATYWLPLRNPSPYSVPERKLFVGMLNKKLNENDVRKLFEGHGNIEECTVLRDQNGQSKGCAFVTFSSKHAAISAIRTLNQNKTMEGCTSPLVVKFADTQKEKEQKKIQQIQANLWNLATNINIPLGPTPTTVSTPMITNTPQQTSPVLGADAITPTSLQLLQQLQAVGFQQQLLQGLGAQGNTADAAAATAAAAAGLLPSMTVQNLAALAAMTQPPLSTAVTNAGSGPLTNTAALLWSDPNALASVYMSTAAGLQFGSAALSTSPLASVALTTAAAAAAGKQIEGPEGCNLFIYHLPQEFTDTDLASTFLPFGNVISAKVFIDKQTNLSKCFGFVSFDHPESAQVAIKAMNGFQVGTKRLKVQLKKPKDISKPY